MTATSRWGRSGLEWFEQITSFDVAVGTDRTHGEGRDGCNNSGQQNDDYTFDYDK